MCVGDRWQIEKSPPRPIFTSRDHGALLLVANQQRKAVQYDIDNFKTASLMTRENISAGLYAPIRLLLREGADGSVAFEYDSPSLTFGQYGDPKIDSVAQQLSANLEGLLKKIAN